MAGTQRLKPMRPIDPSTVPPPTEDARLSAFLHADLFRETVEMRPCYRTEAGDPYPCVGCYIREDAFPWPCIPVEMGAFRVFVPLENLMSPEGALSVIEALAESREWDVRTERQSGRPRPWMAWVQEHGADGHLGFGRSDGFSSAVCIAAVDALRVTADDTARALLAA